MNSFKSGPESKAIRIALIFSICTLVALFFLGQQYFWALTFDKEFDFIPRIGYELIYAYLWGILLYPIVVFANQSRIEKNSWRKTIPFHLLAAIVIALIHKFGSILLYFVIFNPDIFSSDDFRRSIMKTFGGSFDSFIVYWFILGAYYGFDYYKQLSNSKLIESELQKQLAQANLHALKMQLHPHFLFNTLHAVSTLMQEDIKVARKMLAKLSDLLRVTLDNIGVQEVRLSQEIDLLKSYLEIEKMRFQDRLKIKYDIDNNTLTATVPNLILQPLVENAIKHGINGKKEGGTIFISVVKVEADIVLQVKDNGQKCTESNKEGIGLTNTRERLKQLYGKEAKLSICNNSEAGFEVTIRFPFKEFIEQQNNESDE